MSFPKATTAPNPRITSEPGAWVMRSTFQDAIPGRGVVAFGFLDVSPPAPPNVRPVGGTDG